MFYPLSVYPSHDSINYSFNSLDETLHLQKISIIKKF